MFHLPKSPLRFVALCTLFLTAANPSVFAGFITYSGDASAESAWRPDAGATLIESYGSHSDGMRISSLQLLGIGFESLAGSELRDACLFGETSHGPMDFADIPNGIHKIDQWDDIIPQMLAGHEIFAPGFWNGDGQSDTTVASVYDGSDNALGSIGASNANNLLR